MTTTPPDDFDTLAFEKRLTQLKDTQDSINALSSWCLQKREHHKKIVASWLNVLKRARVDQRLTLFYLANDVIQYSKRKNYEFVESWGTTLQRATPLVRDEKVKHRILRIFRIWEERQIYDEEFLTDLTGLLSVTAGKPTPDFDPNDFQATQLVNKIRQCAALETDTDQQLKKIHDCKVPLNDPDLLCSILKERRDIDTAKRDLDDGITRLKSYIRALEKELVARATLCRLLQKANQHYATQRGEVKVVANAYKNFGSRVRGLKRKLDELCQTLPATNSPVPSPPSPGEAVPSPGPDEDLELPSGVQDVSNSDSIFSNSFGRGFSSFVGSNEFPFASIRKDLSDKRVDDKEGKNTKKIEVINTRPANPVESSVDIHMLLKSLIPAKSSTTSMNENVYRPRLTPPPPPPLLLPGLDLLTPTDITDSTNSINFYGSGNLNSSTDANTNSGGYLNDSNNQNSQWNNTWDVQRVLSSDTPESPTEQLRSPPPPPRIIPIPPPIPDVDHRQLLAPPPAVPQVLLQSDDVDHRQLPPLPLSHSSSLQNDRNRQQIHNDVDHRNLISLTMGSIPPPPVPPISPWTPQNSCSDQDYRGLNEEFSTSVPPPLPPMSIPPPVRRSTSHNDHIENIDMEMRESIDMEMSDEESLDQHDDDYRHLRIENSMARIHGQPPPLHHSQPPLMFRKQEMNTREKPFMNNNRHHLGVMHDKHGTNLHHNDKSISRTNLVHINSSDIECMSENEQSDFMRETAQNLEQSNIPDIFNDFQPNAMNPINPNSPYKDIDDIRSDDSYEKQNEEVDAWQNRAVHMNPMTPNAGRGRSMFHQRPPPMNYRRPPPLLSTPTHIDFNPHNHNRGGGNFRRTWGHSRPPRRGKW